MGLGDDIAEVFGEVGSKIEVYKYDTDETFSESIDTEHQMNERSAYLSHAHMAGIFPYNSSAAPGDLISFVDVPENIERYLLIALATERFAGEMITKEGALLKCNTAVEIKRKTQNREGYSLAVSWETVHSGEYGHLTGQISSMELGQDEFGWTLMDNNLLYLSGHLDVQHQDRLIIKDNLTDVSGEAYECTMVEEHRLPQIKMCALTEETRA